MLYWKTFLTMCITCWLITLLSAATIVLDIAGAIDISIFLIIIIWIIFMIMTMASIICWFIFKAEIDERREKHDYRTGIKRR